MRDLRLLLVYIHQKQKKDDFEGACNTFGAQSEAIDINKHLITV